jgi:tetratricopeptide (TPR) repeat protein/O-antigen ligase
MSPALSPGARLVVVALCLMVCAVPLILPFGVYEPVFAPKFLALHLCIALACLGWLIQTRRNGSLSQPIRLGAAGYPLLCFLGVALLASPATLHPLDTLVELTNQAALFILLFVVANTFSLNCGLWIADHHPGRFTGSSPHPGTKNPIPKSEIRNPKSILPVLWSSALTGLAVALIGILQYHGLASPVEALIRALRSSGVTLFDIASGAPPSATFVNRNFAAEYLICAIPLSGLLFLTSRRLTALLLSGLSAALMGVFLVYTRTRASWVGLAGALLCLGGVLALWPGLRRPIWEALRSQMDPRKKALGAGLLVLFVALSALPPHSSVLPETKADIAYTAMSIFQEEKEAYRDHSQSERLAMWSTTLRMVADRPLLGVGPGGWKRVFAGYDRGTTVSPITFPRWSHNDYVEIASEYGLIGLGVYLWFLTAGFYCLTKMARRPDPFSRAAAPLFALSLLATLGDAFFAFPKAQPHAVMFLYLLLGIAAGATAGEGRRSKVEGRRLSFALRTSHFALRLLPALLLLVSLTAVTLSCKRVGFDRHYLNALYLGKVRKDWPAFLTEVQRALDHGVFRPHLLFFKGIGLQNLERYPEAEDAYRQALAYTPYAWFVHAGLGALYLQQGRLQDALAHCQTALSICPGALDVRSNLALIYQQKGDRQRARQEIQAVLQAAPADARSYHFLGNLYASTNQLDSAVVCYEQALRLDPAPQTHTNLADVYRAQGRLQEALPHYQKAIRSFPNNPNILWGLGLALEAAGQRPQAEALYRRAVSLRPDFAQAHFALGNALYESGNYQEAQSSYRTFLDLWRGDPSYARFAREQLIRCEEKSKK